MTLTFGAVEATRARTAADLGALATLNWGPVVGAEVVLVNGGELLAIERDAFSAGTEVRVGRSVVRGHAALAHSVNKRLWKTSSDRCQTQLA